MAKSPSCMLQKFCLLCCRSPKFSSTEVALQSATCYQIWHHSPKSEKGSEGGVTQFGILKVNESTYSLTGCGDLKLLDLTLCLLLLLLLKVKS